MILKPNKQYLDYKNHAISIITKLAKYPEVEIIDFERIYQEFFGKAYTVSMYEIFEVITLNGSFDYFDWFRAWLIFQGEEIYFKTLENPDNLADYIDHYDVLCITPEDYVSIADKAFNIQQGGNENLSEKRYPSEIHWGLHQNYGDLGKGVGYTTDDLLRGNLEKFIHAYPKIWEKFSQDWYNILKDD